MEDTSQVINNRYRIEKKLGQGGTGAVYLATDQYHNQPLAIKILNTEY